MVKYNQKIVLVITRMLSGSLSVFASSIIIYKVYLRYRHRKLPPPPPPTDASLAPHSNSNIDSSSSSDIALEVTTYHRLLVAMSILDVIYAFWAGLGTIPVPANTGVLFGFGTAASCAVQGFFLQWGTAIPIYTATLNTYFMLKIRYNIPDNVLRERYEPWLHGIPLAVAFCTSTVGASLQIFNPIIIPEMTCWIAPYPYGCEFTDTCTRGYKIAEYLDTYVWAMCYCWMLASFLVVLINSVLIFTAIRQQEYRNSQTKLQAQSFFRSSARTSERTAAVTTSTLTTDGKLSMTTMECPVVPEENPIEIWKPADGPIGRSSEEYVSTPPVDESRVAASHTDAVDETALSPKRKAKASRIAATQSFLYCSATFLTAMWVLMPWVGVKAGVSNGALFFLALMANSVAPLHGVANLHIYTRLQYLRLRRTETEWSRLRCLRVCFFSPDIR